jgi:DNA-binding NarL/FixJ family response regulator
MPLIHREEAIQEAIAAAVIAYRRLAAQGRLHVAHPGTIATNAVHHVRNGRHVGGHRDRSKDVLSPTAQRRHGVQVISCDAERTERSASDWKQLVIADRKADIPELAAFRIDFADWLHQWSRRDRKIITVLASGEMTRAVAEQFGISEGRVSQLRRRYEQDWRAMQGEAGLAARAA